MAKLKNLATFFSLSFFFFFFFFFFFTLSLGRDMIAPDQQIEDGQTLVSAGGIFESGFFTPSGSKNRYLGIWYKNIQPIPTVLWVANGDSPITDSPAVLNLTADGNLALYGHASHIVWSTNTSNLSDPIVQLLDSGNLVLIDGINNGSTRFVWQSFDWPSDTLLPGMKLGFNKQLNLDWHLTSWKSSSDPSPGAFYFKMDPHGYPGCYLWNGTILKYRTGSWNGYGFSGQPGMKTGVLLRISLVIKQDEIYYTYEMINKSILMRSVLSQSGEIHGYVSLDPIHGWKTIGAAQRDRCDEYAECGAFGVCNINDSPMCKCLRGFVPKSPKNWALGDGSDGCVRRTALDCGRGDGFVKMPGLKLPDASNATVDKNISLPDCRERCLKNCSCMAFSIFYEEESACFTWYGDLIDIRESAEGGQDLYVRLASSELDPIKGNSSKTKHVIVIVISLSLLLGFLLLVFLRLFLSKKTRKQGTLSDSGSNESREKELDLPLFDMSTIESATDDFSRNNILGKGGFGPVYKGQLRDGQEIAVKRLSKDSAQGLNEFKNEVTLIAKLQHRNLVRLHGCCIQYEERMLIYEYMPNKSLDAFIFDKTKGALLSWQKRLDIIIGIARGLLYLHQDSRLKIIHRDLKASNILLDKDMNPKISDFGTARIFKGDQNEENTRRVIGTYGYMSPEYVMDGIFSIKSDVFSFGVIILEILSGKKNRMVNQTEPHINLTEYAWRLWEDDRCLVLLDEAVECSYPVFKLLRCIQISLLCVQEGSEDRPTMQEVVVMLSNEGVALPQPKKPGFYMGRTFTERARPSTKQPSYTVNKITDTLLEGR